MHRRSFVRYSATGAVAASVLGPDFWRAAFAAPAVPGRGPYGTLPAEPDASGLLLPEGFTSRVIATEGNVVGPTSYVWPPAPDGAATFAQPDGGWIHTVNSEVSDGQGGVSAVRFAADGTVVDAYRILGGTSRNCAGGPTPWGTWLSCEEFDGGNVWECDPTVPYDAAAHEGQRRAALGTRPHEAVAVDPEHGDLYVTEDGGGQRLYRFVPANYPDLTSGEVQAAHRVFAPGQEFRQGTLEWVTVDDPGRTYTGDDSSTFDRGEGCWYSNGHVYFTTTGDGRVWSIDTATQHYEVLYDRERMHPIPLRDADNITVHPTTGDLLVADGNDTKESSMLTLVSAPDGTGVRTASPFARIPGHDASEITGPTFSPDGTRLYFSSQRGSAANGNRGVTYEVTGPFLDRGPVEPSPDTGSDRGVSPGPAIAVGAVALAAAGAGVLAVRRRRGRTETPDAPGPSQPN